MSFFGWLFGSDKSPVGEREERHETAFERDGRLQREWEETSQDPFMHGSCVWCGEPIELADPDDYRRRARTRHRGDEFEVGDRNCNRAFLHSYVFSERELIEVRGDPECIDCGSADAWEADHDVPLWDGGEHCSSNIVRRCVPCHREKTRREATERAARRREERGLPDAPPPLPEHHPGQAELVAT